MMIILSYVNISFRFLEEFWFLKSIFYTRINALKVNN